MGSDEGRCRIAVIGAGPRALGALEALLRLAEGRDGCRIDVFDPLPWPGAGPNFDPAQSPLCLLNLPIRSLDLNPGRAPANHPGFARWLGDRSDAERYPARAELGAYLAARLAALTRLDRAAVAIVPRRIARIRRGQDGWQLQDEEGSEHFYGEVLLAQGQPATAPDQQLKAWRDHARRNRLDLVAAYPDHRLMRHAQGWTGKSVAIRGLGLSTLDALRLLTLGLGGRFENGRYRRSGREPGRILPFSLDGHAPAPKPATADLDARFDPTDAETAILGAAIAAAMRDPPDCALERLCGAMRRPALRILSETGGAADGPALDRWLAVERQQPGQQEQRPAVRALRASIDEARGRIPPSPGYVVGQLMRKWQDTLRKAFNPAPASPATAAALVGFDEGLKRYSYGPPVASAEELLILIDEGLVDPRAARDPDIIAIPTGWRLDQDDAAAEVTAMIDAVLPSPDLGRLDDPLIKDLISQGRMAAVGEGLGAGSRPDGQLIGRDGGVQTGLCLLGRLAIGSVIAVDSIHDCFGAAADRWAEGVVRRMTGRRR